MVEQSVVNRQVIGSSPLDIAKDKVAEWLRHQFAKLIFMSSNLILVSKIGSIEQLVRSPDCKSGLFGACRFEPYCFHNRHLWCKGKYKRFLISKFKFES